MTNKKYACIMSVLDIPDWKEIIASFDIKNLHNKNNNSLENEPHCTIFYGIKDTVDITGIEYFCRNFNVMNQIDDIVVTGVSLFENDEFDVLKFDVKSKKLTKLNSYIKDVFDNVQTYPDYHPHITIAYLNKSSENKKFIKNFNKYKTAKQKYFLFCTANNQYFKWL